MSKIIQCKSCSKEIQTNIKCCPECGEKIKTPIYKSIWFWVLTIIIIIGTVEVSKRENSKESNITNIESAQDPSINKQEYSNPQQYDLALKKAKSYSDNMNMSKARMYKQLTSKYGGKFTEEEAQYAIDNINVDWKVNALKRAESYSKNLHMSKAAIYNILISEYADKFTEEEAQYAIDNVQVDWKANALHKAKSYQKHIDMSLNDIYKQLTSEYGEMFTEEEAQYAIDNLK